MSERSAKRTLGNLPGKEAPDYDVGYGKPPSHSRFKPGQSGNPRGRPRGALDRKNRIPSINREHMKQLVRQVAYRKINILDGDQLVEVTIIEAIIRSMALHAAKGDRKSQQMIVELVRGVEREDKMLHDELVTAAIEYQAAWESELERREQVGEKGPEPLPHPDDITIDMGSARVEFHGPAMSHKLGWQGCASEIRLSRCASSPSNAIAFRPKSSAIRSGSMPGSL